MPAFDQNAVDTIGSNDDARRATARQAAFEAFVATEMPDESEEIWRYIELGFDVDDYSPVSSPGSPLGEDPLLTVCATAVTARIVDGYWIGDDTKAGGVTVGSLAKSSGVKPELVEPVIAEAGLGDLEDRFALAASAFGGDGAFIHVPTGTVAPGVIYLDVQATQPASASFPRIVVAVDDGGDASVVVHLRSRHDDDLIVVPQIAAALGANARLAVAAPASLSGPAFTSPVDDFYLTNPIARASAIMAECSAMHLGPRAEAAE